MFASSATAGKVKTEMAALRGGENPFLTVLGRELTLMMRRISETEAEFINEIGQRINVPLAPIILEESYRSAALAKPGPNSGAQEAYAARSTRPGASKASC